MRRQSESSGRVPKALEGFAYAEWCLGSMATREPPLPHSGVSVAIELMGIFEGEAGNGGSWDPRAALMMSVLWETKITTITTL